jgi:hypothetical protein
MIEIINASSIAGAAQKLSETLKDYNYTIANITTAKDSSQETTIYDYSKGIKSKTVNLLETKIGISAVGKTPTTNGSNADIVIIIGNDYKGFGGKETASKQQ